MRQYLTNTKINHQRAHHCNNIFFMEKYGAQTSIFMTRSENVSILAVFAVYADFQTESLESNAFFRMTTIVITKRYSCMQRHNRATLTFEHLVKCTYIFVEKKR